MRDEQKFLRALVDQHVDVYLISGIHLRGTVVEPMASALILRDDEADRRMLVFAHAFSSIVAPPTR